MLNNNSNSVVLEVIDLIDSGCFLGSHDRIMLSLCYNLDPGNWQFSFTTCCILRLDLQCEFYFFRTKPLYVA